MRRRPASWSRRCVLCRSRGYELYTQRATGPSSARATCGRTRCTPGWPRSSTASTLDTARLRAATVPGRAARTQRRSPDFYAPRLRVADLPRHGPGRQDARQLRRGLRAPGHAGRSRSGWSSRGRDAARLFTWNHDNLANPDAPRRAVAVPGRLPGVPERGAIGTVGRSVAEYGGGPPHVSPLAGGVPARVPADLGLHAGPGDRAVPAAGVRRRWSGSVRAADGACGGGDRAVLLDRRRGRAAAPPTSTSSPGGTNCPAWCCCRWPACSASDVRCGGRQPAPFPDRGRRGRARRVPAEYDEPDCRRWPS